LNIIIIAEGEEEGRILMRATDMKIAIGDFDNFLRGFKHRDLTDDQYNLLEEIKENWYTDSGPGKFYE
jgi:hypothetical protein